MAVGYHKINSSAERSRRRASSTESPKFSVTRAGTRILDAVYREGVTREDFVSESDKVKCEFDSGVKVALTGRAVRCGIESYNKNR